ncbi:MAG: SDR family oxidoreductase [Candidatus Hydrogenedentes bacterium]|nr:SDR family oxidoreductase [Candidatus Hydrogenedentota bacterium]
MRIDLSERVAVVTGATGDLGRVMVRTLAECGADVAVHYHRNQSKADELCAEVEAVGRRACAVQADVTDADSVGAMQQQVTSALGPAGIIVNNAVIQYTWKPVLEQGQEDYESQFRSCVMHNVHMVKAFVPAMIEARWGRVIGINTECSMQCWPSQSAYVSGKHGMNGLLRSLAAELGPSGITVNQVAPGWMLSDRDREREKTPDAPEPGPCQYSNMVPLRHRGEDQDIANAVAFLASELARFITGVFLPVNGGGAVVPAWFV